MNKLKLTLSALTMSSLGVMTAATAGPAAAGQSVDPLTLVPVPVGDATCQRNGPQVICHTTFVEEPVNAPVDFGLECGTIYETALDIRHGIRWYEDGKLVKRFVSQQMDGHWTLSPDGDGPYVDISAHGNWGELYPVPGDLDSAVGSSQGVGIKASAPGFGTIAIIAAYESDDAFHGVLRLPEDPAVGAELCAALGG